jgi:hypothetical protein
VGSGKSTLTAMVIQDLESQIGDPTSDVLVFFFCDRTTRSHQIANDADVFRVLLKQLLRAIDGELPEKVLNQYNTKMTDGSLDRNVCLELLLETAGLCKSLRIVLDAFDECPQNVRKSLVHQLFLPLIQQRNAKAKIFVSSRPGPEFDRTHPFDVTHANEQIHLLHVENTDDLDMFIDEKLNEVMDPYFFGNDLERVRGIATSKLKEKANGM